MVWESPGVLTAETAGLQPMFVFDCVELLPMEQCRTTEAFLKRCSPDWVGSRRIAAARPAVPSQKENGGALASSCGEYAAMRRSRFSPGRNAHGAARLPHHPADPRLPSMSRFPSKPSRSVWYARTNSSHRRHSDGASKIFGKHCRRIDAESLPQVSAILQAAKRIRSGRGSSGSSAREISSSGHVASLLQQGRTLSSGSIWWVVPTFPSSLGGAGRDRWP